MSIFNEYEVASRQIAEIFADEAIIIGSNKGMGSVALFASEERAKRLVTLQAERVLEEGHEECTTVHFNPEKNEFPFGSKEGYKTLYAVRMSLDFKRAEELFPRLKRSGQILEHDSDALAHKIKYLGEIQGLGRKS